MQIKQDLYSVRGGENAKMIETQMGAIRLGSTEVAVYAHGITHALFVVPIGVFDQVFEDDAPIPIAPPRLSARVRNALNSVGSMASSAHVESEHDIKMAEATEVTRNAEENHGASEEW